MQHYDEYKDSGVEWIGEIPEECVHAGLFIHSRWSTFIQL